MALFKAAPVARGMRKIEWCRPGPLPIPGAGVTVMPTESYRLRVGEWRCPKGKSEAEGLRKNKHKIQKQFKWLDGASAPVQIRTNAVKENRTG